MLLILSDGNPSIHDVMKGQAMGVSLETGGAIIFSLLAIGVLGPLIDKNVLDQEFDVC